MATTKQKIAAQKTLENIGKGDIKPMGEVLRESGYSDNVADNPKIVTESKGWNELMNEYLSDEDLAKAHKELLSATKIEHMTFPLGPKDDCDPNFSGANPKKEKDEADDFHERTTLTDQEIKEMLSSVNCQVRRIVHGETARHVYFWAKDNNALKSGLDLAYKLKGKYAPDKSDINLRSEVNLNEQQLDQLIRARAKRSNT